jgi:hypothetical protein
MYYGVRKKNLRSTVLPDFEAHSVYIRAGLKVMVETRYLDPFTPQKRSCKTTRSRTNSDLLADLRINRYFVIIAPYLP